MELHGEKLSEYGHVFSDVDIFKYMTEKEEGGRQMNQEAQTRCSGDLMKELQEIDRVEGEREVLAGGTTFTGSCTIVLTLICC